jgi:hypothetical protein
MACFFAIGVEFSVAKVKDRIFSLLNGVESAAETVPVRMGNWELGRGLQVGGVLACCVLEYSVVTTEAPEYEQQCYHNTATFFPPDRATSCRGMARIAGRGTL